MMDGPFASRSWSASAVADSPVAASSDKQERQDRAQKYRARAGDILKLTDGDDLSITKQAEALNISRGSVYYLPRLVPDADLAIMRRLDRPHLELPFAGSRMLQGLLVAEGHVWTAPAVQGGI
jgi:hypothetical protein